MKKLTAKQRAPRASGEGDDRFRDTLELSSGWYWEQDEADVARAGRLKETT